MIALQIQEVKAFMSSLLIHNVFDDFLLSELDILTFNHFHIEGKRNKEWYTEEELELLGEKEYSSWADIKPIAFQLIKGNKTPHAFKIVFILNKVDLKDILEKNNINIRLEEINGVFVNLKYEKEKLSLITGTSVKVFTMDKTLDREWDESMKAILRSKQIEFEEL